MAPPDDIVSLQYHRHTLALQLHTPLSGLLKGKNTLTWQAGDLN